jgi:FHA domain
MQCPHCATEIDYCPCCGNLLATNPAKQSLPKYCRHCGEPIRGVNKKYCRRCGSALSPEAGMSSFLLPNKPESSRQPEYVEESSIFPHFLFVSPTALPSQTIYAQIVFESSLHNQQLAVSLDKPSYLIGKLDTDKGIYPEIDLSDLDAFGCISRRQARLFRQGNYFYIEDLGSANGTTVYEKGKKVRLSVNAPYPLHHGSRIQIGNVIGIFSVARGTQSLKE